LDVAIAGKVPCGNFRNVLFILRAPNACQAKAKADGVDHAKLLLAQAEE
jgi:hypothetical protein